MPNPKVSKALEKIKQKKEKKIEEPEETPEATEGEEKDPERISVINALQNAGVYRREVLLRLNDQIVLQKETNEKLGEIIELLKSD